MYNEFFGFSESPFSITPDTSFFFGQQSHKDALNTLLVALKHCEGFIKIVGEVGTGKTLLSRILLSHLGPDYVTAYLPNPNVNSEELYSYIAAEIGADKGVENDVMPAHERMSSLYRRLMQLSRAGKHVVVIIDEAQAMPRDSIEALRLLGNLETEKRKLIQVVIFGQPELDSVLNRADLRQLKQRIVFAEQLHPFTSVLTRAYVCHRLNAVGSENIFSWSAFQLVFFGSGGIPRLINILCHKAMICAYGRGDKKISAWHMAKAIFDTGESRRLGRILAYFFVGIHFPTRRFA